MRSQAMQPIFGRLLDLSSRAFAPTRRRDRTILAENEMTLPETLAETTLAEPLDEDDTTPVENETIVRDDPFVELGVERAIALRWTLRDVLAHRTKFLPVAEDDLRVLVDMGLVEMQEDEPALTSAGKAAIA